MVGRDHCVRWRNRWLQIEVMAGHASLSGKWVTVKQLGDGRLVMMADQERLVFNELPVRPEPKKQKLKAVIVNNRQWKPSRRHPWHGPARLQETA